MIKDIYLIHDSHTDIGYTNTQGRILRWYSAFARQAIEIAEQDSGFRWTCETFIQVEQFWQQANDKWRQRFIKLVRDGQIGLSANWANFNELPDEEVFEALTQRARRFTDEHGLTLNTAVLADINGCPLAYARALVKAGVTLLLTHVNPWHGRVMQQKRMKPFWWDLGNDEKLLVYYNEHYHFGNELGFFPGAEANASNFSEPFIAFDDEVLNRRLPVYLRELELAGWAHDFLIVTGSGLITDNSPPSRGVTERISRWNADPTHTAKVHMITASDLEKIITGRTSGLPTFSGDWPDWWADGMAGDPEGTMLYRQAQRERRWLRAAGVTFPKAAVDFHSLDTALGMYAEHTYGHCASVTSPWNSLVQQLHVRKVGYAAEAADLADCLGEQAAEAFGHGSLSGHRPLRFVVVNPHDTDLVQFVEIEFDTCEIQFQRLGKTFAVVDEVTNQILPHQPAHSLRGVKILIQVSVPAESTCGLFIRPSPVDFVQPLEMGQTRDDQREPSSSKVVSTFVENEYGYLAWDNVGRLIAWGDRKSGRDITKSPDKAFVLEMNRSPAAKEAGAQFLGRAGMGENRQAVTSQHFVAKPSGFRELGSGPLFDRVEIDCEAPGFEFLKTAWTVYRGVPMVDVEVICHKIGTWDSENVYCPLPFNAGVGGVLWVDRGYAMRPWQDQLPGTLTDFYGVQEGVAWCADGFGVAVAMLDSHLIHCGDLKYRARRLMGDRNLPSTPDQVHAWLMTNYWETNFSAELGGFYSFRFRVGWGSHLADPTAAIRWTRLATAGLKAFRQAR